ncbi:MAG: branched-chain amino acid aminotransferase [Spirochaetes bacterium]|nr:branched-chain amino acid aminotransferase [Spirochaetota bacterium]
MKQIDWDNLGFDINPAEKMFVARHTKGVWDSGGIVDYGTIQLFPSAVILNYGQGLFEGMKAYRTKDNRIAMFQPHANARRLNDGCRRLCMPELDEDFFVESIKALVRENRDYVPPYGKGDLYIRPILFGSGQMLGVSPATEYMFIIFMSPVGPYFKGGFSGIHLQICTDYHRASLLGTGGVKAVGNYAASLMPKALARDEGFDEVLYLDARCSTYVEEVGSANFFLIKNGILSTPRLGGSILPGTTREEVLMLAEHSFKLIPQGRDIRYDELFTAEELFCTGTAAVITPILSVTHEGKPHTIGNGKPGALTRKLYDELKGIQLGERPDIFNWLTYID